MGVWVWVESLGIYGFSEKRDALRDARDMQ